MELWSTPPDISFKGGLAVQLLQDQKEYVQKLDRSFAARRWCDHGTGPAMERWGGMILESKSKFPGKKKILEKQFQVPLILWSPGPLVPVLWSLAPLGPLDPLVPYPPHPSAVQPQGGHGASMHTQGLWSPSKRKGGKARAAQSSRATNANQSKGLVVVVQNRNCSPLGSPYKSVCWETVSESQVKQGWVESNPKGESTHQLQVRNWWTALGHLKQGLIFRPVLYLVLYPSHPLISQIHPNQPEIDPKTNSRQYAANNTKCCR